MSSSVITQTSSRKTATKLICRMPDNGQCPYCNWKCKSLKPTTFAMHISRKHAEELGRAVNPYACHKCSKTFTARTHLNHHIANHHNISYQDCPHPECNYVAKNKCSLMAHYATRHMKVILDRCKDSCITCSRTDSVTPYHIAKCHPLSPFSK